MLRVSKKSSRVRLLLAGALTGAPAVPTSLISLSLDGRGWLSARRVRERVMS
jgi:hypothetical protein